MTAVCFHCQAALETDIEVCPNCGQLLDGSVRAADDAPVEALVGVPHEAPLVAEIVAVPPKQPRLPQPGLLFSLLLMLGLLIVQVVAGVVAAFVWVIPSLLDGRPIDPQQLAEQLEGDGLWLVVLLSTAAVVGASALLLLAFGRSAPRAFALRGISPVQWLLVLLLPLPAQFLISVVGNWIYPLLPEQMQIEPPMEFVTTMSLPLALLAICVFPGVGEEVFFRGVLGRGLTARWGPLGGILLTSLFFGMMHMVPIQVFATFILGLAFHLAMVMTRSLLAPILMHVVNNGLAVCIARYGDHVPIPGYTSEVEGTPWLMVAAALPTVVFLSYALYLTRSQWLLPDGRAWSPGYFSVESPPDDAGARLHRSRTPLWLVLLLLLQYGIFLAAIYMTVVVMIGTV